MSSMVSCERRMQNSRSCAERSDVITSPPIMSLTTEAAEASLALRPQLLVALVGPILLAEVVDLPN